MKGFQKTKGIVMLTKGSINASIREVLQNMVEYREYELLPDAFDELNNARVKYGYSPVMHFSFRKDGSDLVFNWKRNNWRETRVEITNESERAAFALVAFSFSFVAFSFSFVAFSFAENRIQPIALPNHDGEEREIDGRRYRLELVES